MICTGPMVMVARKKTSTTEALISPTYMPASCGLKFPLTRTPLRTRHHLTTAKEVRLSHSEGQHNGLYKHEAVDTWSGWTFGLMT